MHTHRHIHAHVYARVPTLKHKEVIATPVDRFRLQTEPTGEVHVRVGVITKDFMLYLVSS